MSEIITDKLTGKTSAGDVEITSEGGAVTMQLQQGVAKAFELHDGGTTTVQDSLNVSSLTDVSTGVQTVTFSNNMSSAIYVKSGSTGNEGTQIGYLGTTSYNTANTTSAFVYQTVNAAGSTIERNNHQSIVHGDLA